MRHRNRITYGLAGAALLVSVLFVGGALRETQALVAVLVAGALGMQLFARRRLDRTSPLLVFLGIAIGLTVLQLIPLPDGLREFLDPTGEGLRSDGAALTGTSPWQSLSLDPAGTLRALTFLVILGGIGFLALRFAASERGRFALLGAVAATCGLAALVSGIHALVNASSLYGVYAPAQATPRVFGPLLNGNHMGSLMALGAVLSIGLAFYTRQRVNLRVLWIVNAIGCVLVVLATLSRGAVLAFAFGLAVTGAALIAQRFESTTTTDGSRRRRRPASALTNQLPLAIIIAFGLGVAIYSSAGKVATQLDNTSLTELSQPSSKYAAWKSSLALVHESPWVGIGRGALEPTFTRVHDPAAYVTFSHLENEYLQAVVEWGVIGSIVLVLAFGWCLITALRRWRDGPLAAAALGGIAGVLLQSTVDFGLELLGLAVPMTIAAATLLIVPLRESSGSPARTRVIRGAVIAALVAVAVLVLQPAARSVQEDHDALLAKPASLEDVHEVIERHPLDYFGYGHAASLLMRTNDPRAAKYLNHALVLHPTHPGLHHLVARILVATNRHSQAAVQYSLALKGSASPKKLLPEILVLLPDVDDAAAAIPLDIPRVGMMFRTLQELKRSDVAMRWLIRVIAQPQRDTAIVDRLYNLAMSKNAFDFAHQAAKVRMRISRTTTSRLMLAKVQARRGEQDLLLAGLADIATWRGRIDEKAEAWFLVCDVRIDRKQWDQAVECIHRLDGSGAVTQSQRTEVNKRLNFIKEQRTLEARKLAIEAIERDLQRSKPKPNP